MATTTTQELNPIYGKTTQNNFGDWLFSSLFGKPDGGFGMAGSPAYPNSLSPDVTQTLYPQVWNNWSPRNGGQGQDALASMLTNNNYSMPIMQQLGNMQQTGGVGGFPTDQMQIMAQYGGVGAPAQAMSNLWQYGAASQAGQPIGLTSQYGGYGDWGKALQAQAAGQSPAAQYLAPFLQGKIQPYQAGFYGQGGGWRAPNMPQAQVPPQGGK